MRTFGTMLAVLSVVGTALGGAGVAHAAERRSKTPNYDFTGEWRTAKGASPSVSVVFRGKTHEVTIDGKVVAMTGGVLSLDSFQKHFNFEKVEMKGKYGGESYTTLGFIAGILDSREVLSGFYSEIDHNPEGEEVRGFMAPVVLYQVSGSPKR